MAPAIEVDRRARLLRIRAEAAFLGLDSLSRAQARDRRGRFASGGGAKGGQPVTGDDALRAASVPLRTAAERTAYSDYVSEYRNVNGALRENGGKVPQGRAFSRNRRIVSGLDSGMKRAGVSEDIRVHRLTGMAEFDGGAPSVGAKWTDHGFVSTSTQPKVPYPGEVSMRITVPKGTRAVSTPELDKNEVLLDRGMSYRVTAVSRDDRGGWQVDAEVVGSRSD